jgi:hypothetical protein
MESKEAFAELKVKLDKSLEEYNRNSGKKVMVIPKPGGETFYIFNRRTVIINAGADNSDVALLVYYDGQKDVPGGVYENEASWVEEEELTCFPKAEKPYFSFPTMTEQKDTDRMVNVLLTRIFRGRKQ